MLNELKIKKYCEKNGYNYRYFEDMAIIMTSIDTWNLQSIQIYSSDGCKDMIKVKHMNKAGNKSKKAHFYTQRTAYDMDYVFNNIIIPHEKGNRVYQKAFRIKEILSHSL